MRHMGKLRIATHTWVAAVCVVAVVAAGITSCGSRSPGGGARSGGTITMSMTTFPDHLDPQLGYTLDSWEVLWNTYVPLLTYRHVKGEAGTEVVPALAKDMPQISDAGTTYKLTLRPNMKYSDGTPIKASDFAYAIKRMFKTHSGGSVFYKTIVGAKDFASGRDDSIRGIVTDDNTGDITIHLEQPSGTFTNLLAMIFAAPVPKSTPLDQDTGNNPPASSGPFVITKADIPKSLTMERNPNFHTVRDAGATEVPDAHVDKIVITQNGDESAQTTAVERNEIDFMDEPPDADRLPEIRAKYGDRFRFEDSINVVYFWMNNQKAPFNDLRVRQAINYAIDPGILNRLNGGRLSPGQQILPEGLPGHVEYKLYPGPDIDKAKQLLAEARPADRDITVWTSDEPVRKRTGKYYRDVLTELGFAVTLKIVPASTYINTIGDSSTPDLDTGLGRWFQDFPHPDDFFRPLLKGTNILPVNNNNFSRVAIPEFDDKQVELATLQLSPEVEKQYADLDRAYMEQAVWAPYGSEQYTTFMSERMDVEKAYSHLLFNQDFSAFALK